MIQETWNFSHRMHLTRHIESGAGSLHDITLFLSTRSARTHTNTPKGWIEGACSRSALCPCVCHSFISLRLCVSVSLRVRVSACVRVRLCLCVYVCVSQRALAGVLQSDIPPTSRVPPPSLSRASA